MKNTILEHKGFRAQIMKAPRLKGKQVHELPPGTPISAYTTDEFEHPLPHWLKGPGNFVVPVGKDDGLWFNWQLNDQENTAVMPTVKGMNPITGRRTSGFSLERYETKCPIHEIDFEGVRFCKECGYKWPAQNYLAAPNTLWWDGFLTSGKVRQFFFTEDMDRSVPEKVIGKDDTVPAFGFAFFRTKVYRQSTNFKTRDDYDRWFKTIYVNHLYKYPYSFMDTVYNGFHPGWYSINSSGTVYGSLTASSTVSNTKSYSSDAPCGSAGSSEQVNYCSTTNFTASTEKDLKSRLASYKSNKTIKPAGSETTRSLTNSILRSAVLDVFTADVQKHQLSEPTHEVDMDKEVGVGAGAEIKQDLQLDPLPLSGWEEEPASVMRIYFVFEDQFKKIVEKGMKNLEGHKEGFLSGLQVG